MAIVAHDILGSDQVGVHLAVIGSVVFHPPDLPMSSLEVIETTLECEPAPMSIGGSNLLEPCSPGIDTGWPWRTSLRNPTSTG